MTTDASPKDAADAVKGTSEKSADKKEAGFPYAMTALLSLAGLAAAGGLGSVAIDFSQGKSTAELSRPWGEYACIRHLSVPRTRPQTIGACPEPVKLKPSKSGAELVTISKVLATSHSGEPGKHSQMSLLVSLPLAHPHLLFGDHVEVIVRYRLSRRWGWVNPQITGIPWGDCVPEDRPLPKGESRCERWYAGPGAQEGYRKMRLWVPVSQIRLANALKLELNVDVTPRRNGRLQVDIDQIEIIQ